jgi:hypothetical protein
MNDFLKKLKESLESGEKNEDLVSHLNVVEEKSVEISKTGKAEELIEKRLEMAGERVVDLSKDEIKAINKTSERLMNKMKEEDEKWSERALILNMKQDVKKIEDDFKELKEKYLKTIQEMNDRVVELEKAFKQKYGEENLTI